MLRRLSPILLLAACAPAAPVPPVAPVPAVAPVPVPVLAPVQGVAGTTERQPDLCHAKDYAAMIGQPGTAVTAAMITRKYRIVEFRGIEPEVYDPQRVVFRLDAAGTITNVDCG